jgi:hypothetical protein
MPPLASGADVLPEYLSRLPSAFDWTVLRRRVENRHVDRED